MGIAALNPSYRVTEARAQSEPDACGSVDRALLPAMIEQR